MTLSAQSLKDLVGKKPVYIYAANPEGVGYCKLFTRMGLDVKGFLDSRVYEGGKKVGKPVLDPETFFAGPDAAGAVVLIATKHRKTRARAIEQCKGVGLEKNVTLFLGTELCATLPTIEVVGTCNLRCISCPVALPGGNRGGLMKPATYRQVLEKMTREIPFMNSVYLYMWGEPLLHPELAEIIRITTEFGIASEISTNLNQARHLESVIQAGPDLLTVACSGVGANYEVTHTGGDWEKFHANLHTLRAYIDKHRSDTTVRLVYHMYKHNLEGDYNQVEQLARDLRFTFVPLLANVFPQAVFDHVLNGVELPDEVVRTNEMLIIPIEEQLAAAHAQRHLPCPVIKAFPNVRWDLSVVTCCNTAMDVAHPNYLEVDLSQLVANREKAELCGRCQEQGLHRFFDVNATVKDVDGKRVITRK